MWSYKAYSGRVLPEMSGKEAAALGFVNKAVPIDKLEQEVMKWAEALSQLSSEAVTITKEWINGTLDITGMGATQKGHFLAHLALQYVHFRPDEVNLYKAKKDKGLKGFLEDRAKTATPEATE